MTAFQPGSPTYEAMQAEIERLRALLREALLYDSQIIHMESWWRKTRRALEPKP